MKREQASQKFQLMIEPSLIARIDTWRFANRVPSRASAFRTLLNDALKAKGPASAPTLPSHGSTTTPCEGKANEHVKD